MHGRAGPAPHPLPPAPLTEPGGEGGGKAGELCLAWGSWAGKGGSLAQEFGGSCSRVDLACFHGKTFWRVCLAGLFGGSIWRVYLAHLFSGFFKARKDICC